MKDELYTELENSLSDDQKLKNELEEVLVLKQKKDDLKKQMAAVGTEKQLIPNWGLGVERFREVGAPSQVAGGLGLASTVQGMLPEPLKVASGAALGPVGALANLGENKVRQFSRDVQQGATEIGKEYDEIGQGLSKSKVGEFTRGLGESAAGMVPQVIASRFGGFPASIAVTGLQTAGSTFTEAVDAYKKQGLSIEDAEKKALIPSVANGFATALVTKLMGKTGLDAPGKSVDTIKKGIWEVAKQVGLEGGEEAAQSVAESIIKKLSYKPDMTLEEAGMQAAMSALAGGVMTLAPSALRTLSQSKVKQETEQQQEQPPPLPTGEVQTETPEQAKIKATVVSPDEETEYDPTDIEPLTEEDISGGPQQPPPLPNQPPPLPTEGESNAIQKPTANEVPVQPSAGTGEAVEGTLRSPEGLTEEGQKIEEIAPDIETAKKEQARLAAEILNAKVKETPAVEPTEQAKGGELNEEAQRQEVLTETPAVEPEKPAAEVPVTQPENKTEIISAEKQKEDRTNKIKSGIKRHLVAIGFSEKNANDFSDYFEPKIVDSQIETMTNVLDELKNLGLLTQKDNEYAYKISIKKHGKKKNEELLKQRANEINIHNEKIINGLKEKTQTQSTTDKIIAALDKAIEATNFDQKTLSEGVTGAPVWLVKGAANGTLRVVRAGIQAGKTLYEAIEEGLKDLRSRNLNGFNEDEARQWITNTFPDYNKTEAQREESQGYFYGEYETAVANDKSKQAQELLDRFPDNQRALESLLGDRSNIDSLVQQFIATGLMQRIDNELTQANKQLSTAKGWSNRGYGIKVRELNDLLGRVAKRAQEIGTLPAQQMALRRRALEKIDYMQPYLAFRGLVNQKVERVLKRILTPTSYVDTVTGINNAGTKASEDLNNAINNPSKPISRAELDAKSLISKFSNIQKDTPEWKTVNQSAVVKLFNDYLKGDIDSKAFTDGLLSLGVSENTTATLSTVADQELKAREANRYSKSLQEIDKLIGNDKKFGGLVRKVAKETGIDFRELFAGSTAETQIERRANLFKAIDAHPKLKDMTRQQKVDLEVALTKAWEAIRKKNIEAEIKRAFKSKNPEDQKKIKASIPKLLKWANMGMLDEQHLRDAIAEKFNLPTITGKVANELKDLGEKAQKAPEGVIRNKILSQMVDKINSVDFSKADLLKDFWFANVLSSTRTFMDVVVGNLLNGTLNLSLSAANAVTTGNPKVAALMFKRMITGLLEGAANGADIIWNGDYSRTPGYYEKLTDNLNAKTRGNLLEFFKRTEKKWGWKKAVGQMAYSSRIISGLDYMTSIAIREALMPFVALRRKDMESLKKMMAKSYADDVNTAKEQAIAELGPDAKWVDIKQRTREIVEQGISESVKDGATRAGQEIALNADLEQGLSKFIYDRFQTGAKTHPFANFLFRAVTGTSFLRSVLNFANLAAIYTPGLGLVQASRGVLGNYAKDSKVAKTIGLQLPPEKMQLIVSAQIFSGILSMVLAKMAIPEEDKEPVIKLTGGLYGVDYNTRKKLQSLGVKPYTITIGDTTISYKQLAIAPTLAVFGNFVDQMRYNKDKKKYKEKGTFEKHMDAAFMGMSFIKDISALSQLASLLGISAMNTQAPDAESFIKRSAAALGNVAGGFVPAASMLKDIDSMVDKSFYRKNSGADYWLSNIPFVRRYAGEGAEYDFAGNKIDVSKKPWSRWINQRRDEPLYEVMAEKASKGMMPPMPGNDVQVYDPTINKKRDMTDSEVYKYQVNYLKLQGEKLRRDIDRIRGMNEVQFERYKEQEFDSLREIARRSVK